MTHPSRHFSGQNISALKGFCALKFLGALQIDQGYLAHTPNPQRNLNRENLKFGLKLGVWASITSMLVWISSPNFYRRRDELWSTNKKAIARILIYPKCLYIVSWRTSLRLVVLGYSLRSHSPAAIAVRGISMGVLKSQVLENVSMENTSKKQDILQRWKMQVLKTQVRVRKGGKRKYGKRKYVLYTCKYLLWRL